MSEYVKGQRVLGRMTVKGDAEFNGGDYEFKTLKLVLLEDGSTKWIKLETTYAQKDGSKVEKSNVKFHGEKPLSRTEENFLRGI